MAPEVAARKVVRNKEMAAVQWGYGGGSNGPQHRHL